jgi:hypothetical protein
LLNISLLNATSTFTNNTNKIIHKALDAVDYVALAIDGWSDRRCRSFLDVTCHFLNSKMEPQTYIIDFVRFKSHHTGENIHQMTECILDRLNIKDEYNDEIKSIAKTLPDYDCK